MNWQKLIPTKSKTGSDKTKLSITSMVNRATLVIAWINIA